MNLSFSLFRLQSLDTQIRKINRRIARIDEILLADEAARAASELKEKAMAHIREVQAALNDVQDQLQEKRIKLDLNQNSLFGGKIHNPKELQELQAESEGLRRTIHSLEDSQLTAMIQLEDAQKALAEAESALQAALNAKASENSLLLGEKKQLLTELPQIKSQRHALVKPLPPEVYEEYVSLYKTKGGKAVAAIIDGCCDACGAEATPGDIQAARSANVPVHCKTCGRILYKD